MNAKPKALRILRPEERHRGQKSPRRSVERRYAVRVVFANIMACRGTTQVAPFGAPFPLDEGRELKMVRGQFGFDALRLRRR